MQKILVEKSRTLKAWLSDKALPHWAENGFRHGTGCFAETLSADGVATEQPVRSRVFPRQIFCFAQAGLKGWNGEWPAIVSEGLKEFDQTYLLPSGFFAAVANRDGEIVDDSFDLYNQAFAILAFAYVARVNPDRAAEMGNRASEILELLRNNYRHSYAGFHEAIPHKTPLCSNPHMHLFEASLACETTAGFKQDIWYHLSDEIAHLCLTKFIDSSSGALREFFDLDWQPASGNKGRIVEPGHQFEWAWLLAIWAQRRSNNHGMSAARRLFDIGEAHGICPTRQVAVMTLYDDFSIADPIARLWPQTEWLKAAVRLGVHSRTADERTRYVRSAISACDALTKFLEVEKRGLWRDKMLADGSFVEEPTPASSLYHILCAIYELDELVNRL